MLNRIKKVEYLENYKLKLTFSDKKQKIVDFEKYKTKDEESVFYPFKDLGIFKSVKLDKRLGTIVWPNEVDLCPDTLYLNGKDVKDSKKQALSKNKKTHDHPD